VTRAITLLTLQVRRERWLLPAWMGGIVGLYLAVAVAIGREFAGEDERRAIAVLAAGNPAFLFLRGLPDGIEVGALVFFQGFSFLAVLIALMNTFLIVRHTRADEEKGRSELLVPTGIARTAELRTALTIAVAADLIVALAIAGIGLALGFGPAPSVLTGSALGVLGILFAAVAALAAQLMPSSRGANGVAAALVGIAYVVRGIGDALGTATDPTRVEPSWFALLSPIGWAQATMPYSTADARPVIALAIAAVVAGALALTAARARDLGASLLPERGGRERWAGADATRLSARLQRPAVIGWTIGVIVLGGVAGGLAPVVSDAVDSNAALAELIANLAPGLRGDTEALFTIALLGIAGALAAAAGITAILRLHTDESEGRAEVLLTTRLRRIGWLVRQLIVAAGTMIVVAIAAATAAGVGLALAGGELQALWDAYATVAVHLPAGAIFVAITAVVFAAAPRLAVTVGWGAFVLGLIVGQLGDLLALPDWLQDVSPFHHVPAYPLQEIDVLAESGMLAITLLLAGFALLAFRFRDVKGGD
jgi:ABC-2 type transport system permease protein